jgi:sporulation protein YlmC with PRC-barrel domain
MREERWMKMLVSAVALTIAVSTTAFAQPAQMLTTVPTGKTIANYYKQNVYDPSNTKIGSIDDMLIDDGGKVTSLIVGVGGFLGMGEKDVAIAFNAVKATMKDSKWYLTLDTTKDALKAAPGFTYDSTKTTWVPAAK